MSEVRRNAVILAAGTSSRFVPLSEEIPKGLLEVRGEILIERQIRQLMEAGVEDITIVTGYMADKFDYLRDKFGVSIVRNSDYARYNNTSSLIKVLDRLDNTYICSSDNYFPANVFLGDPDRSYYSAVYAKGPTGEYCLSTDRDDIITGVEVGGSDSWYMKGHVYFSRDFSSAFRRILKDAYSQEEARHCYWEDVYRSNIGRLPGMRIHRYEAHEIEEFDSLDELRVFDSSYLDDTRSQVIKRIARELHCRESELSGFRRRKEDSGRLIFTFSKDSKNYLFNGEEGHIYWSSV